MTQHLDAISRERRTVRYFWIGLAGLTLVRVWCSASTPLTGEEAYYWAWSQAPDLSYFDHPPMVGWVLWLVTTALGQSVLAVRTAALLPHVAAVGIVFHCTRRLTKDGITAAWAGALYATGIWFAVTATIILPDSVLFVFWAAAVWLTLEAIRPGRQWLWPVAGLALGLSGLSKFHGILLALSIGLFLILSPRQRHQFRSRWFYLGVLIAGLTTLPVFIWNMREGWPTFAFQLAGRHRLILGSPVYVLEMLAAPLGYIGPVMFPLVAAATVWGFRKGLREGKDAHLFLAVACALPYCFFLGLSLFIRIDPQWAAPAFVTGVILAACFGLELARDPAGPRWRKRLLGASVMVNGIMLLLACGLVIALVASPELIPRDLRLVPHRAKTASDRLGQIYGWEEIGERLRQEIKELGGPEKVFIYARTGFGTAASFRYYAGGQAQVYIFDTPPQRSGQLYIWERHTKVKGMNAVVIAKKLKYVEMDFLATCFRRVARAPDLVIVRNGEAVQHFFVIRAWDLQQRPNEK